MYLNCWIFILMGFWGYLEQNNTSYAITKLPKKYVISASRVEIDTGSWKKQRYPSKTRWGRGEREEAAII